MITALALIVLSSAQQTPNANEPELHCVKTLAAIAKPAERIDYRGIRYGTCCEGCAAAFVNNPDTWLKTAAEKGVLVGYSLFDVVTGARVIALPRTPFSDYKAVRYYFKSDEDKTQFDADPYKFATAPKQELMYCSVQDQVIKKETDSAGYVDVDGARYYVCCGVCFSAITKDPTHYTSKFSGKVTAASPHILPKDQ